MSNEPAKIPKQNDEVMQGYIPRNLKIIINEYSSMGKKSNFMCSHIDSLTGVKRPITGFFPDQSYRKCARVPVIKTKTTPIIVKCFNCFMNVLLAFYIMISICIGEGIMHLHAIFIISFPTGRAVRKNPPAICAEGFS